MKKLRGSFHARTRGISSKRTAVSCTLIDWKWIMSSFVWGNLYLISDDLITGVHLVGTSLCLEEAPAFGISQLSGGSSLLGNKITFMKWVSMAENVWEELGWELTMQFGSVPSFSPGVEFSGDLGQVLYPLYAWIFLLCMGNLFLNYRKWPKFMFFVEIIPG